MASCSDFGILYEYFSTLVRGGLALDSVGAVAVGFAFPIFLIAAFEVTPSVAFGTPVGARRPLDCDTVADVAFAFVAVFAVFAVFAGMIWPRQIEHGLTFIHLTQESNHGVFRTCNLTDGAGPRSAQMASFGTSSNQRLTDAPRKSCSRS